MSKIKFDQKVILKNITDKNGLNDIFDVNLCYLSLCKT